MNNFIKKEISKHQKKIELYFKKKNEEKFLQSINDYWIFLNNFRNLSIRFYDDPKIARLFCRFFKLEKKLLKKTHEKKSFNLGVILVNINDTGTASVLKRFIEKKMIISGKKIITKVLILHENINKFKDTDQHSYAIKNFQSNYSLFSINKKKQIEKSTIVTKWLKKNEIDFCFSPNHPFVNSSIRKNNILVHGVQSQDHHTFSPLPNIGDISFFLSNDQIFKYKSKPKKYLITGLPKLDKEFLIKSKSLKKQNFKLPKNSVISATTNLEKCLIGNNPFFLNLIGSLCRKNKNYKHLFIGTQRCKDYLDDYLKKNKDLKKKIIFIGPIKNIFSVLKMIDFFINSFPISGGSSIEAGFVKKPSIDFIWDKDLTIHPLQIYSNPKTTVYNDEEFLRVCQKLITSKTFRKSNGLIAYNTLKGFDNKKEIFYKICKKFLESYDEKINPKNTLHYSNLIKPILKKEIKKRYANLNKNF